MPPELKEGQFDIFLLFCEEDNTEALKFLYFLEEQLRMRVCYIGENFNEKRNQFDSLEEAINRSLYTFIFVTETLIGDKWLKYKHDAALAESINTNGEFVIPVRAENCKIPFSLQPLTALRIYHIVEAIPGHPMFLLPGESEPPIDMNSHAAKQIPFVKNQIVKLVGAKERLKKRRLQMDEEKKEIWREDEKVRKYKESKEKQLENEKRAMEQALQKQDIDREVSLRRQNLEQSVRQEVERKKEMEMNRNQQGDNVFAGNNLAAAVAFYRQHGRNDLADLLVNQQLQNPLFGSMYHHLPTGFNPAYMTPGVTSFNPMNMIPGVPFLNSGPGLHFHLPSGFNPADLAPRPTINLQVQQLQNMQLGNQNQIVEEAAAPSDLASMMQQAPFVPGLLPYQTQFAPVPQPPAEVPSQENRQPAAATAVASDLNFPTPEQSSEMPEQNTPNIELQREQNISYVELGR